MRNRRYRGRWAGAGARKAFRQRPRSASRSSEARAATSSLSLARSSLEAGAASAAPACPSFFEARTMAPALVGDAVDALIADFLGHQGQPELRSHGAGEESADRVRLPANLVHDCRDGRAIGSPEHGQDLGLLRVRADGALGM